MRPRFFTDAAEFRRWLASHHASETELLVGFYRKSSGRPGISYNEAVDEALCYGWIDGIKKRVDAERYTHRFTPRQSASVWSLVNTRRAAELIAHGRMAPAGLDAYNRRDPKKTGVYSFERAAPAFTPDLARAFRQHAAAWRFFGAQPPGYRRLMTYWVMSAKQPQTRERRLAALVKHSAEGKRIR